MYVRLNIINLSTRITRMTWVAWRCSFSQSRCKCETRIMTRRQEDVVRYVVGCTTGEAISSAKTSSSWVCCAKYVSEKDRNVRHAIWARRWQSMRGHPFVPVIVQTYINMLFTRDSAQHDWPQPQTQRPPPTSRTRGHLSPRACQNCQIPR